VPQSGCRKQWRTPLCTDAFALSSQDFARKYAGSAFERVGRLRVARNALVVLANTKDPAYLPLVSRAATDNAAFIRAMAAWALVNLGSRKEAERLLRDPDETVRQEAAIALERSGS